MAPFRTPRQLQQPPPADPREDAELERRRAQRVAIPPEQGPRGPLRHPPLVREQQRVVRLRYLRLGGGIDERIAIGCLVGIRLMRLRGCDHRGRLQCRQLAHRDRRPAVAHLNPEDRVARGRERGDQRCDVSSGTREPQLLERPVESREIDRKSTRLNSSHLVISYAVFCLKKKKKEKPY